MTDAIIMIFEAIIQAAGAVVAFSNDGVMAKLLGLLFSINVILCIGAAMIFGVEDKKKGR